eukprot:520346_1
MSIKSVQKDDIVHIKYKDDFIGIVRYIGYVNKLSNSNDDEYIGIEIQIKRDPNTYGNTTGEPYFKTIPNNGLFIKEDHIIRKFAPAHLLQFIQQQIPPQTINEYLFPPITDDGNRINNHQDDIKIQNDMNINMNNNNNINVNNNNNNN